jgi:cytochrome c
VKKQISMRLALALAFAGVIGAAAAGEPGREIYERQCRTCHGGTAPADSPIGPVLVGIIGTKAGTQPTGLHSRAMAESGIVWDRESLRRFLIDPQREAPGTIMPVRVSDAEALERLLDYLESLR